MAKRKQAAEEAREVIKKRSGTNVVAEIDYADVTQWIDYAKKEDVDEINKRIDRIVAAIDNCKRIKGM